jgi:hypothetical protein
MKSIIQTMSIKNLLCDLPEELADLLYEQLDNCDYDFISLRNELTETKAALAAVQADLAALQLKYDMKDHENKILLRGLKYHVNVKNDLLTYLKDISIHTAQAISIGEEQLYIEKEKKPDTVQNNYEWDTSYEIYSDISVESDIVSEPEHTCSLQKEVNIEKTNSAKPKTFIDFNGIEQVKYNNFDEWISDKWFKPIPNNN